MAEVLASAAYTTEQTAWLPNYDLIRTLPFWIVIDVTTWGGAGSLTLSVDAYDSMTDTYYELKAFTAITAAGSKIYSIREGATVAAPIDEVYDMYLPTFNAIQVKVAVGDATSHTYSVSSFNFGLDRGR